MRITIHYNGTYCDELHFEAETIDEAKEIAYSECEKRGWETENCWSEVDE